MHDYPFLSCFQPNLLNYKVFNSIPEEDKYYAGDIAPVIQTIIEKHGLAEWRAGILTNELHGHIGIYAIIGMKMGLRAREYFNIGLDDLQIQSLAGQKPPVSCMNDGLQVSTGSSLGHGLIHAEESDKPYPGAIFIFKSQKIKINLKIEYTIMIRTEVQYAVENYSLGSENYWKYIRELAIKYWVELDRNKIFVINKIK